MTNLEIATNLGRAKKGSPEAIFAGRSVANLLRSDPTRANEILFISGAFACRTVSPRKLAAEDAEAVRRASR